MGSPDKPVAHEHVFAAAGTKRGFFQRLHGDRRGAMFVEFIIAFLPTFILYLGVTEVSLLYVSKLKVIRAAAAASRAAAVVLPDHPDYYQGDGGEDGPAVNSYSGARAEAIRNAAIIPLMANLEPARVVITFNDGADSVGGNEDITIQVRYEHRCIMPMVRGVLCRSFLGFGFGTYITDTARITNHGSTVDIYEQLKRED